MIDIDELEALAKAATPGPWRGDRIDGTVKYDIVAGDYPNGEYTVVCHGDNGNACNGGYGFASAENEDYVLAANPVAILALIAEVRALREFHGFFRDRCEGLFAQFGMLAVDAYNDASRSAK